MTTSYSDVPSSSQVIKVHLETMMYAPVKEEIYIEADVEDSVQTRPATILDPEEWGPGRCFATILWPKDDDPTGVPTKENVERHCMQDPSITWTLIPFDD